MSKLKMFEDKILVRPIAAEKTTPGGIVLAATTKPKQYKSTVVHTGPGLKDYPITVKPGDVVIHPFPGTEYDVEGETLQLLRESDLVGILPA